MKNYYPALVLLVSLLLTGAAQGGCSDQAYYIDPTRVDLSHILAPPPQLNSPADKHDVEAVFAAQRLRTSAEIDLARSDAEFTVFRFSDVLGTEFKSINLPLATMFFERVFCDENGAIEAAKQYFLRPRPFVTHQDIKPVVPQLPNASYPSGHSTFAYVHAILLAIMIPEKAGALFARADQYAYNRVIAGVHYPSDIEAGRISAAVIDNIFLHDSHFMRDFENARTEIRHALKLDAAPNSQPASI